MTGILGLRTVDCNRKSYCGFQWPSSGKVVAPDWNPEPVCGFGLHALAWGIGDGELLNWKDDAIWQAVWINPDTMVDLDGKVKFPECVIAAEGSRETVIKFMVKHGANPTYMVGGVVVAEDEALAGGHRGQAFSTGDNGAAMAPGNYGRATANGVRGRAVANGDYGRAVTNGDYGQAIADGYKGHATADGFCGAATANGLYGQATALGDHGLAKASGIRGVAIARGSMGRAVANGQGGHADACFQASAGDGGCISITTCAEGRVRVTTGYVGENGIKAGVLYEAKKGVLVTAEWPGVLYEVKKGVLVPAEGQ